MGAGLGFSPIVGLYWANVSAKSFQVRFKGRQGEGMGLQNLEKTSRSLIKKGMSGKSHVCACVLRSQVPPTPLVTAAAPRGCPLCAPCPPASHHGTEKVLGRDCPADITRVCAGPLSCVV